MYSKAMGVQWGFGAIELWPLCGESVATSVALVGALLESAALTAGSGRLFTRAASITPNLKASAEALQKQHSRSTVHIPASPTSTAF